MTPTSNLRSWAMLVAALAGIAVPALIVGRAALGVSAVLFFLGCLWLCGKRRLGELVAESLGSWPGRLLAITLLAWLPAVAYSLDPVRSFEAWIRLPVFLIMMGLLFVFLTDEEGRVDVLLKALVVSSLIAGALAAIGFLGLPELMYFARGKGWHDFNITRDLKAFSSAAMLLIPVLVWAAFRLRGWWTVLAAVAIAGLFLIIQMTHSKSALGGLIAIAVAVGIGVAISARTRKRAASAVAVVVLVAGAALANLYQRGRILQVHPEVADLDYFAPIWLIDYIRQIIWEYTLGRAMESPWVGHGINVVNFLPGADQPIHSQGVHLIESHPHNWMVEVFAETGIVGVTPLILFVCALFVWLYVSYRRAPSAALLTAIAVSAGYWASGLFNFSFWAAWWQVSYLILLTPALAAAMIKPRSSA